MREREGGPYKAKYPIKRKIFQCNKLQKPKKKKTKKKIMKNEK